MSPGGRARVVGGVARRGRDIAAHCTVRARVRGRAAADRRQAGIPRGPVTSRRLGQPGRIVSRPSLFKLRVGEPHFEQRAQDRFRSERAAPRGHPSAAVR